MARSGIRVKIQVTIGYLIGLAATSFVMGILVTILVVTSR